MKRHDLSRKQFLSLGLLGGLGFLAACGLDEPPPPTPAAGSGGAGSPGTGGSTGSSGASATGSSGNGGASTSTSSGASGSGGSGGSGGSTGSGGAAGGSAGAGGASGGSGSSGAAGSAGGSGGSAGQDGGSSGAGGVGGSGGSKDAGPKFDGGACSMQVVAAISLNHNEPTNGPHRVVIPVADILDGVDHLYQTISAPGMPAQNHEHWIRITAAEFALLRAGMTVTKRSCDGHEHQYALRCGTTPTVPASKACMIPPDSCGNMSDPC